ncbi:MAG: Omp28-related outer membrane protein [Candidatus Eiseniibacteriota bacterium]|jgi:hypothetical protein
MRRRRLIVSITAIVLALAASIVPGEAAQRLVLFEQFTNTSCGPCASAAPTIEQILQDFETDIAAVKYHVWWPGANDPFYLHNTLPVQTRTNYYGITGVPDVLIDAINGPDPGSYSGIANAITSRMAVASPLAIGCSGLVFEGDCDIDVEVTVETAQPAGDYRLFVELIEKHIAFNAPNGEHDHYVTFRHVNQNEVWPHGEPIDLTATGTQSFQYSYALDASYNPDEMAVTVFVQNMTTREILQAGDASLVVPYVVDMALTAPHTQIGGSGEPVSFAAEVANVGAWNDTYDISVSGVPGGWSYSYTTPAGTFSGPSTLPLTAGNTAPITLEVDSQGNPGSATLTIEAVSQGDPARNASVSVQKVNGAQVLLVDDDGGGTREVAVESALDAAGVLWGTWDLTWGELTTADLETAATVVVWLAGDAVPSLTPADRAALGGFMDGGGKLLLTGQEIAYDLADPSSPNFTPESITWFVTYLHALYTTTFSGSLFLTGVPGDVIGDGLDFSLEPTGPYGQSTPDVISPGTGATTIITYDNTSGWNGGIRWDSGATQLVYLTFGLEGILQQNVREELTDRILAWFGLESNAVVTAASGVPPLVALAQNTPNPFRPTTSISYRLAAPGAVTLRVYDVAGHAIRTLVDRTQAASSYRVDWDGTDDAGQRVASGVYFYRLEVPGAVETRRMVLTR